MSSWRSVLRRLYAWSSRVRWSMVRRLELADGVLIKGRPIIEIAPGAAIRIGADVTINSVNVGYHTNMHSPVKLVADKPGALIQIGARSRIHGTCIHAYRSISIGQNCLIAANCQIIDSNGHELSASDVDNRPNTQDEGAPVLIEDSVWIGANSFILPGVRIGRGSIVAACSVVSQDIPSMVVVAGNPARIVKQLS